jgi:glutamate carboxypeptidase
MNTPLSAAMLEELAELVTCESPSSDLGAVALSAHVVAEVGKRRLGLAPEIVVREGCTHLRWRFGAGDRVLLLGHHDTVWPHGSLAEHPWRVTDGVAFGPGCFDMKAGLVQMMHAVAALDDPDGITILVTGDEELGAPTSRGLVEEEARDARVVLCLEGSADGGALKVARKGVSLYEVAVRGKAAHAGLEPHAGVNATVEVANLVLALAALDEGPAGCTVTPTRLSSGTSVNTVPSLASVALDVRCPTRSDQERIDHAVRALQPVLAGATLDVTTRSSHPPLEEGSSRSLFGLARAVAAARGLEPPIAAHVGGASDANIAAGVGAATLDGLGAVGGNAHAPGEHVIVAAMPERASLVSGLLERVLGGWSAGMNAAAADGAARR